MKTEVILFKQDIRYEKCKIQIKLMKEGILIEYNKNDDQLINSFLNMKVDRNQRVLDECISSKNLNRLSEGMNYNRIPVRKSIEKKKNRFWIF